jgi:hypothetical protein
VFGEDQLKFWASGEAFQPAFPALDKIRRRVLPFLNEAFAGSSLAALHCELRYIPIAMPEDMQARHPERSELRKNEKIYVCAPILDYDVFVAGIFEDQLQEYMRGIALSTPHLADLGASAKQIEDFKSILKSAVEGTGRISGTTH